MNGKNPLNIQIYSFKFVWPGCPQMQANAYAGVRCAWAPRSDSEKLKNLPGQWAQQVKAKIHTAVSFTSAPALS